MGEETGSGGLRDLCAENREAFRADVLIASDGPRLSEQRPTIYLGSRGAYPIDLWIGAREGGHHSGNWGSLLSNPAVQLAHALSTIVGPTGQTISPRRSDVRSPTARSAPGRASPRSIRAGASRA
jgi:acetylornithine deacetylase/succinyl-diaminopimelate desuccinylase-like protein